MNDEPNYQIVGRVTKPGYHLCDVPPTGSTPLGTVSECGTCGTWWILRRRTHGSREWSTATWLERREIKKQRKKTEKNDG